MSKNNWVTYKMSDVLEPISIPVDLKSGIDYREIGIRSHGKGIFHKEITDAETIGNKRVFKVIPNALIFNIVFAWEQAVAKTSEEDKGFIASHRFPQYIPKDNLSDIDYLLYLFMSPKGKYLLNLASPGGAGRNKTLGKKAFDDLELKLPTNIEQQKIVKILSTWDKAISTTERLIDNSTQQKRALMQQLLTGKKRLLDESGQRFKGEWEEVTLEEAVKYRRGSFPQPYGNPEWVDEVNGYPFVQVYDIAKNMKLKPDTKMKISDAAIDKSVFIPKETIIVSLQGSIGRVAITQYDAYVDRTILLFQEFLVPMNKMFFAYIIQELFEIEKTKAPGGTIKTITKAVLSNFKVLIPPLKEQQKIATVLTNANKEIELLEQQLADLQQEKKALMQVLLTGKKRVVIDG